MTRIVGNVLLAAAALLPPQTPEGLVALLESRRPQLMAYIERRLGATLRRDGRKNSRRISRGPAPAAFRSVARASRASSKRLWFWT